MIFHCIEVQVEQMNVISWLILSVFVFPVLSAGQCLLDNEDVPFTVQRFITYGRDTTYDGRVVDLYLHLYRPQLDSPARKPFILWVHGGGFFGGNPEDMDALCRGYAAKGFVTASASYRLGFFSPPGFEPPAAYDEAEIIRAGYRAVQDIRSALRYCMAHADEWQIDINKIIIGGGSAGGITVLAAATMRQSWLRPIKTHAIDPVIIRGDTFPRPDLGPIEGKFHRNYRDTVHAVINIFGALPDTAFLHVAPPLHYFLYHQTLDPVVPCDKNKAYWPLPYIRDNYPSLAGSCAIAEFFNRHPERCLSSTPFIYPGTQHGVHDTRAFVDSLNAFLRNIVCDKVTNTNDRATTKATVVQFYTPKHPSVVKVPVAFRPQYWALYDLQGYCHGRGVLHDAKALLPSTHRPGLYLLVLYNDRGQTHAHKVWL